MENKTIIYYTDSRLEDLPIAQRVRDHLLDVGLPIVSSSLKPLDFGRNIYLDLERGYETMFKQILACLEEAKTDIVFFCEHDVLYPKEHFDFTPGDDTFYYDINWWKVRSDGLAVHWDAAQVSGLACYRQLAVNHYKKVLAEFDPNNFGRKFEPTVNDEYKTWKADKPHIDVRGNWNLTYNKWKLAHFRKKETAVNFTQTTADKIPGWKNVVI